MSNRYLLTKRFPNKTRGIQEPRVLGRKKGLEEIRFSFISNQIYSNPNLQVQGRFKFKVKGVTAIKWTSCCTCNQRNDLTFENPLTALGTSQRTIHREPPQTQM